MQKKFPEKTILIPTIVLSILLSAIFMSSRVVNGTYAANSTNKEFQISGHLLDSSLISQPTYEILVDENVAIPMADGTLLKADIYRPKEPGKYPVLVGRVGYKLKDWAMGDFYPSTGKYYARQGYVVVWQNCRGTFNSEGDYYPFRDDAWGNNKDGYETVEWAAQQEWSNGKIGMLGVSYSGLTQYLTAPTRPPHLQSMFVQMGWGSARNCLFQDGVLELYTVFWFPLGMTLLQIQDDSVTPGIDIKRKRLENAINNIDEWHKHLPYKDLPPLEGLADWYFEWLDHPADGSFWHSTDPATMYSEVDVPILHWNGWFDYRLDATLEAYTGIKAAGISKKCRDGQRLVIGPWNHWSAPSGILDYGPDALVDADKYRLRWYDYWLKGINNGIMDEPPVRIFLMGENRWINLEDWPPRDMECKSMYLHEGTDESPASLNNGLLSFEQPRGMEQPDSLIYDPMEPAQSLRTFSDPGPHDYASVESSMLTYTSKVLEKNMTIIGPIKAILYGKSSARDTDWVVRLCDVWPDGRSISVCNGILRARYRKSKEREELMTPGQVYRFEINMSATAQVFKEGHRIRVQISNSDFPWYDRNLNTGGPFGEEVTGIKATNTVLHDNEYPSHVILPIR